MHTSTHSSESPQPAVDPRIAEGVIHAREGRYEAAETCFRGVLAESAGTGSESESRACLNLGTLYGIEGRSMEALLLYRHGMDIAREQGHALATVIYLANIGGIYVQLGMHAHLPGVVERIEKVLASMPESERASAERYATWQRYELASWEGDVLGARRALDRIRREFEGDDDPRVRSAVREIEAHELLQAGLLSEAVVRLDEALADSSLTTTSRVDLLCQKALVLEKADAPAEATDHATQALDLLHGSCATEALCEESIAVGKALAGVFIRLDEHEKARRTYDLVATAILRRMHQVDACLRDMPALGIADAADRAWIGDLRDDFETEQEELRARVLRLLDHARRRGVSPVHDAEVDDDLVRICAWCGLVRAQGGRWVPIRQYLPPDEYLRVTHTICPACGTSLVSS